MSEMLLRTTVFTDGEWRTYCLYREDDNTYSYTYIFSDKAANYNLEMPDYALPIGNRLDAIEFFESWIGQDAATERFLAAALAVLADEPVEEVAE